jgi:hypothetical protein
MSMYDPRFKATVRDTDLFFWSNSLSLSCTVSTLSDSIDLGAEQVFKNIPVSINWYLSGDISVASSSSAGSDVFSTGGERPGMWIQHCNDNSQFSSLAFVEAAYAASALNSTTFNKVSIGLCSVRRYVRLRWALTFGGGKTMTAWLRMGQVD